MMPCKFCNVEWHYEELYHGGCLICWWKIANEATSQLNRLLDKKHPVTKQKKKKCANKNQSR